MFVRCAIEFQVAFKLKQRTLSPRKLMLVNETKSWRPNYPAGRGHFPPSPILGAERQAGGRTLPAMIGKYAEYGKTERKIKPIYT